MKLYTDLHIHTALSPCGDNDMTPNNIINMALIKKLDVIAITDHNSCENAAVCVRLGKKAGIIVIPGMELQTREDIHAVCLFKNIEAAEEFQKYIYSLLPDIENKPQIFGEQLIFDEEDHIVNYSKRFLLTAADISFDRAFCKVSEYEGIIYPAHVDRDAYSIISSLGFIPDYLPIKVLEYNSWSKLSELISKNIIKDGYKYIKSSDAHYLENIAEREYFIEADSYSIEAVFKYFY